MRRRRLLNQIICLVVVLLSLGVGVVQAPIASALTLFHIRGTVTDTVGRPLVGANVSDGNGQNVTTNASGQYDLEEGSTGRFTITVSRWDLDSRNQTISVTIPLDRTVDFTGAFALHYRINASVPDVDLTTHSLGTTFFMTVNSFAPNPGVDGSGTRSCVFVSDTRVGWETLASLDSVAPNGVSTWKYRFDLPQRTRERNYNAWYVTRSCSDRTALSAKRSLIYTVDNTTPKPLTLSPADRGTIPFSSAPLAVKVTDLGGAGLDTSTLAFTLEDTTAGTSQTFGSGTISWDSTSGLAQTSPVNFITGHLYRLSFSAMDRAGNSISVSHAEAGTGGGFLPVTLSVAPATAEIPETDCDETSGGIGQKSLSCPGVLLALGPSSATTSALHHPGTGLVNHTVALDNARFICSINGVDVPFVAHQSGANDWSPRTLTTTFSAATPSSSSQTFSTLTVTKSLGTLTGSVPATCENPRLVMRASPFTPATQSTGAAASCELLQITGGCSTDLMPQLIQSEEVSSNVGPVAGDIRNVSIGVRSSCGRALGDYCGNPSVAVSYQDRYGQTQTVSASGQPVTYQVLTVQVPADAVRFPSLGYSALVSQSYCRPPSDCSDNSVWSVAQSESSGTTLPVDNVLRFDVKKPDGSASDSTLVMWTVAGTTGDGFTTLTDDSGYAEILIPQDHPVIQNLASSQGYANIDIRIFDDWPGGSTALCSLPVAAVSSVGHASGASWINLGSMAIPPVNDSIQDGIFNLVEEEITFTQPNGMPNGSISCGIPGLPPRPTYTSENLGDKQGDVLIANNVGGTTEMSSTMTYKHTINTSTTVSVKASGSWTEAKGKVKSETNSTASVSYPVGPADNKKVYLQWIMYHRKDTTCYYGSCASEERIGPKNWSGGSYSEAYTGLHGRAAAPSQHRDCVVRSEGTFTSSTAKGREHGFSVSAGGGNIPLTAQTDFQSENTTQYSQTWRVTARAYPYHFVWVFGAWMITGETHCPYNSPGEIWTQVSTYDMTNVTPT